MWIGGIPKFSCITDFRVCAEVADILEDRSNPEREQIAMALLGTDEPTEMYLLLSGGHITMGEDMTERDFSFSEDADYIYSAFFEQYGIDLLTCEMHWWKFLALFNGLHDTVFNDIRKVRGISDKEISQIKDGEKRREIMRVRERVQLYKPLSEEDQKNIEKFNEIFG